MNAGTHTAPIHFFLQSAVYVVFALSLPPHHPYDCAIDLLPGAPLPVGQLYNLSVPEKETMRNYVSESLASGIIRLSSSPVAAGFFFVAKKDGSLWPCIDYRQLNSITVKNKYPLPLLSSMFEPLTHPRSRSSTCATRTIWYGSERGTNGRRGLTLTWGHFEYLVMPFELTNAPTVFQALINDVLWDFLKIFVVVYLDDILVFSKTATEHSRHVRQVLQHLLENRLFVKAEKCVSSTTSVEFLGHVLEEGRVRADPKKIWAVEEWPRPANQTQLRRFLGFANFYRRFIRGFSRVAAPLSALTSTTIPFSWTPKAEEAFVSSRRPRCSSSPTPVANSSLRSTRRIRASGLVLSQRAEEDQQVHPVAFLSRRFTPA